MKDHYSSQKNIPRRHFFQQVSTGIQGAALTWLLSQDLYADSKTPTHKETPTLGPHHKPRAKSVIHLFMNGGPSQMDLFDPKPFLDKHHGKEHFDKIAGEVEFPERAGALMKSPFKFAQHGESGMWVSDVMPHLAKQVDEITMIRSMFTTNLTHEPALYKIQSGSEFTGHPALGAWVSYGLGSENKNLPAYVVLDDPLGLPVNGIENWQSGFLPAQHQGTRFRATGSPVLNLKPGYDQPEAVSKLERDLISRLDQIHQRKRSHYRQLESRLSTYALAARMQISASDALDLSQETEETQKRYGIDQKVTESYGRRCLIARRLVERGVRFVQLFINSQIWDTHSAIATNLKTACQRTDQPVAALLQDLKQRGLLDDTLVMWGGEMGRLPIAQLTADKDERKSGRDHNKNALCTWMAGGGVKKGMVLGETDELGFAAVENRVSVPDWHATMLHLLGLNHEELFIPRNGLNERLTGVGNSPRIVKEILA
ncbi:DUF1501 domain-containing protein [Gimesia aquarii]|uniref:Sulfatase n=1 Tax=Gimesia aquarii TaxID=2527964 RepID=A0A517VVU7_9PLAN|nr:DUF1501 domain-containing protein [Gimesia aquarii]QDT97128.1 hypothetical protein V144x_25990 [Gimesia aquarii]